MGWLFVASFLSSSVIRESFVTVFRNSNKRIVFSAMCLNYSNLNGLSVIHYRFNQSIFFYDLVPLSLLTGHPPFPCYISTQFHGKKYPLRQLLMNADVVLIFFNRKLKTVLLILVAIAIIGYLYIFIVRNLTQYHNSWTADAVAICCHCHNKFLCYESCVVVMYNLILRSCWKSCVTVSFSSNYLFLSYNGNLYLSMGGYLHSRTAQRSAALWRASALDLNRRSLSWPLLLLLWSCVTHPSVCTQYEVNITWLSRSSSATQLAACIL